MKLCQSVGAIECHRSSRLQLMFPLHTKLLPLFPGRSRRRLLEQRSSRCHGAPATPGDPLGALDCCSTAWYVPIKKKPGKPAPRNREMPCQKASGPYTSGKVCGPRGSPGRQTGADVCCLSQQHKGDYFRHPPFTSKKRNETDPGGIPPG